MTDIFKSADWAREAERARAETERPDGLIGGAQNIEYYKRLWAEALKLRGGKAITEEERVRFLYGDWPTLESTEVSGAAIMARSAPTIAEVVTADWPTHEREALSWLARGSRVALLAYAGSRPSRAVVSEIFDRWRALPLIEIKHQSRQICAGGGVLAVFTYDPRDQRAWETLAGLRFDFAAIDPCADGSKMAAMLLSRVRSPA